MSKKFMVYDTATRDMLFHDSEEKAQKDYDEATRMILEGDESGHTVYLFEVKKQEEVIVFDDLD